MQYTLYRFFGVVIKGVRPPSEVQWRLSLGGLRAIIQGSGRLTGCSALNILGVDCCVSG